MPVFILTLALPVTKPQFASFKKAACCGYFYALLRGVKMNLLDYGLDPMMIPESINGIIARITAVS
jgi:hypothetical protein